MNNNEWTNLTLAKGSFAKIQHNSDETVTKKIINNGDYFLDENIIKESLKCEYLLMKTLYNKDSAEFQLQGIQNDHSMYKMTKLFSDLSQYITDKTNVNRRISIVKKLVEKLKVLEERISSEVQNGNFTKNNLLIHNDLKPNNIMISKNLEIFIIDWSLSPLINNFSISENFYQNILIEELNAKNFILGNKNYNSGEKDYKNPTFNDDLFSLKKVINFVMNTDPKNSNHIFNGINIKIENNEIQNYEILLTEVNAIFKNYYSNNTVENFNNASEEIINQDDFPWNFTTNYQSYDDEMKRKFVWELSLNSKLTENFCDFFSRLSNEKLIDSIVENFFMYYEYLFEFALYDNISKNILLKNILNINISKKSKHKMAWMIIYSSYSKWRINVQNELFEFLRTYDYTSVTSDEEKNEIVLVMTLLNNAMISCGKFDLQLPIIMDCYKKFINEEIELNELINFLKKYSSTN